MTAQTLVSSENWDDDFEFGQNGSTNGSKPKTPRKPDPTISFTFEPRLSIASSHLSEDWDADDGLRSRSPKAPVAASNRALARLSRVSNRLDNWGEPGPSTPTKHGNAQPLAENWDDDFEDKADSPPNRRHHAHRTAHRSFQHHHNHTLRTRHSYHTPPRPKLPVEPENWDDDFDDPIDPMSPISPSKSNNDTTPVMKRSRRETYVDSSDEENEVDFGFPEDKEEDKTLTADSRTAPMTRPSSSSSHLHAASVPTVPQPHSPSPIEPFPRSPSVSVFSIPTTSGRNSIGHFNSTSHLVLSGAAASLAMLPPSPPLRERRRLRKKSRPPHLDNNVFELIEEQRDSSSPPLPPSTPERERTSSPPIVPMMLSPSLDATPSSGSKTPLLARIGSVKKWGVRRKRASTGPPEVMMEEFGPSGEGVVEQENGPRPPSSLEQIQPQTPSSRNRNNASGTRSAWFFRPGGARYGVGSPPPGHAELKHEKSLDRAQLRPGAGMDGGGRSRVVPATPSKGGKLSKRKPSGVPLDSTSSGELTGDGSSSMSGVTGFGKPSLGLGRRPSSMQVPNGVSLAVCGAGNKFSSVGTRHASYGSSVGRASSSRVFSSPTPAESMEELPPIPALPLQEGSRSFMGNVRKISLVGNKKHKKKNDSIEIPHNPPDPGASVPNDIGDSEGWQLDTGNDALMQTQSQVHMPDLLPPIELHPPSPPRTINASRSMAFNMSDGTDMIPSISAPASITMTSIASSASPTASSKATPKSPSSPQSASLGRTTQAPHPVTSNTSMQRRNSLGDLKIPARISQAQIGLKRDLGMVREFATSIDGLKELQSTYHQLLAEVQTFLENAPPSRATSPTMFHLARPRSRLRSNTSPRTDTNSTGPGTFLEYKYIAATLHTITVKYKISWECAELLIELGGGSPSSTAGPTSGVSAPILSMQAELDRRKNRERAITLSGEDSKLPPVSNTISSPPSGPPKASWRASTGRHDLSQRQLVLLRDMLNNGEIPHDDVLVLEDNLENVNRNWRWGDAMGSTVTLPSEESSSRGGDQGENTKKKRRSGRMGLTGLRDMLRMLKWSHSEQVATPPVPALPAGLSTASLSTDSSHYSHHYPHGQLRADDAHRVAKTGTGSESVWSTKDMPANSPYNGPALNHKSSPRRPSLASIFRIGQKNKGTASSSAGESSQDSRSDVRSASRGSNMTGDEDWDRIEPVIDLDIAVCSSGIEGTATIKGRKGKMSPFLSENPRPGAGSTHRPVTPRRVQDSTALRLEMEASPRSLRPMRSTRLSNVEEVEDGERQDQPGTRLNDRPRTSPHRPPSRSAMPESSRMGSVRSAPPQSPDDPHALPEIKLSMTPDNIKPLLENAKEVHLRCHECIRELRVLLDATSVGSQVSAT